MIITKINKDTYQIKLPSKVINIYDQIEVQNLTKEIIKKINKKNKIRGLILLEIYEDINYGTIVDFKNNKNYETNEIEVKITIHTDTQFLYKIDYFDINKTLENKIYYYKNNFYLELNDKIDKKKYKDYSKLELSMYMNILLRNNFSGTSEFYEHICNNHLVDDFSYTFTQNDDYALILFEAVTSYAKKLIELLKEKLNNLEINENDFNRKKKVFIANAIVDFENAYQVNNEIRASILKYNKMLNDIPSSIENLKFDKFAKVKDNLGNETAYVILKPIKKEE